MSLSMGISDEIDDATIAIDKTSILEIKRRFGNDHKLSHSDKVLPSSPY